MSEFGQGTEAERGEMFREFHAEHLRRQTKAIEQIRGFVAVWFILMVLGALFLIIDASQASSGGY